MNKDQIKINKERIEREFLPYVQKPSQYIGGEINQLKKNLSGINFTFALCFPDLYEVGMSNTGLSILYHVLNHHTEIAAERVFCPQPDAEKILREKQIPLFSLESKAPLKEFDAIGFSLSNELCYTNVLNILELSDIELRSKNRTEYAPFIIGGGAMANCCEPVADFFDFFILGEAEQAIIEVSELLIIRKKQNLTKSQILKEISNTFSYCYVPEYYDGKTKIENAVVKDFENAPIPCKPIVPYTKTVHERISIEIMRGCPGRCLFCQASFCRRPVRFRTPDTIFEAAKKAYESTGFDTISLLSLSSAEYPKLEELTEKLKEYFTPLQVGISLPSLRVDKQLKLLPKLVSSVRKSGLTIAVETAPEKLRDVINKPLKNEDLYAAVTEAYKAGWQKLKLYFMAGLAGETIEDVKEIVNLSYELAKLRKKVDGKTAQINAAVSWFVPKPHTPMAWTPQKPQSYFEQAKKEIIQQKKQLKAGFLNFKFHFIERSVLESAIGRGGREMSDVIETAFKNGARFDLWNEHFDYELWESAFKQHGFDMQTCAEKNFAPEKQTPWQHLGGPKKDYLLEHYKAAMEKISASPPKKLH
jgi:radical SAM family uncharacterized protein